MCSRINNKSKVFFFPNNEWKFAYLSKDFFSLLRDLRELFLPYPQQHVLVLLRVQVVVVRLRVSEAFPARISRLV